MKKIKKIGGLVTVYLLALYNTCFADVIVNNVNPKTHGYHYYPKAKPKTNYVLIGALVLVIVVCTIVIIKRIIKNKKEKVKENENNNN